MSLDGLKYKDRDIVVGTEGACALDLQDYPNVITKSCRRIGIFLSRAVASRLGRS
jgi:hypothetical protein